MSLEATSVGSGDYNYEKKEKSGGVELDLLPGYQTSVAEGYQHVRISDQTVDGQVTQK